MLSLLLDQIKIDAYFEAEIARVAHESLRGGLRGPIRERRNRRGDLVDAELDSFQVHEWRKTGQAVAVQCELGATDRRLQRRHKRSDSVGSQQAAGVADFNFIDSDLA